MRAFRKTWLPRYYASNQWLSIGWERDQQLFLLVSLSLFSKVAHFKQNHALSLSILFIKSFSFHINKPNSILYNVAFPIPKRSIYILFSLLFSHTMEKSLFSIEDAWIQKAEYGYPFSREELHQLCSKVRNSIFVYFFRYLKY